VIIVPSFLCVCVCVWCVCGVCVWCVCVCGVCVCVENRVCRFDMILSHIMRTNIITLTHETADPIDKIMFHVV
jgi:hypothetical protein